MKYYRMSYEQILWGISFANLNMLLASIPEFDDDSDEKEKTEQVDSLADLQSMFKE